MERYNATSAWLACCCWACPVVLGFVGTALALPCNVQAVLHAVLLVSSFHAASSAPASGPGCRRSIEQEVGFVRTAGKLGEQTGCGAQESTIGAAFLTKTIPEKGVKFEIWWALRTAPSPGDVGAAML